ncbi:hypothetical protein ACFLUC_01440 [Chloroflexota bacterium]
MSAPDRLPASILGGDPFNQFRFLYRWELLWKLFDERYCLSVMRAAYEAGGKAFDLSFDVNTRLMSKLIEETGDQLIGFGNPTWEQGVILNGRFIQYSRDRILRTLVDRLFPRNLARLVEDKLSREDVLVFGYDRKAETLSDEEIESIYLDRGLFRKRLSIFKDCQYIFLGGSDADWLVPLGRTDILVDMADIVRQEGFIPIILCQYATLVVPEAERAGVDTEGYAVPLNKEWSWFDRNECVDIISSLDKPVIAFMPLASGKLREDVPGALEWLYRDAGVESILYGTATKIHAAETTRMACEIRDIVNKTGSIHAAD